MEDGFFEDVGLDLDIQVQAPESEGYLPLRDTV